MQEVLNFIWNNGAYFLAGGWVVCEILAQIPSIKANSVFQFIFSWFQSKHPKS